MDDIKPQHDLDAQKQGRAWITDKGRAVVRSKDWDREPDFGERLEAVTRASARRINARLSK